MDYKKRIAVILFNLGGPDSKESIRPFLTNFFSDKRIITLPSPLRQIVADNIAKKRASSAADTGYAKLGYKSPLLENTVLQADALKNVLAENYGKYSFDIFIAMRYWTPRASEVIKAIKKDRDGYDTIVLLPLYPQFSSVTTGSSFAEWKSEAKKAKLDLPTLSVCCYPALNEFVRAAAEMLNESYNEAWDGSRLNMPRILFSAHGLPESIIKKGDPYQKQCEISAKAIIDRFIIVSGGKVPDWELCYQSKVGRKKWISPSIEKEIIRAGKERKSLVVYPLAFVSEHIETLVELDIEHKELANSSGVPVFSRVDTVGVHQTFINGLAKLVFDTVQTGGYTKPCSSVNCLCR